MMGPTEQYQSKDFCYLLVNLDLI